jgi:AraC-like DNA-binding protein
MNQYTGPGSHIWLDARLWKGDTFSAARSREVTPCYFTRCRAARGAGRLALSQTWEFSCIVAGYGELRSSRNLELAPATIYLIPPGLEHAESSDGVLESIWMGIDGDRLPEPTWDGPRSVRSPEITQLFEQAWRLAQHRNARAGPELDGLTRVILGGFLRLVDTPQTTHGEQLVQAAIGLMYAGFHSSLSIGALARELNCSVGYFQRTFRRVTQMSPSRYLTQIRLQHALMWLENTELTVGEVAAKVGYADPLYFSRLMRKEVGLSPTQFRARNGRPNPRRK